MRIPAVTYRLQFNPNFTFKDAQRIVTYLAALGITDLYASPIFNARSGSTHGYDVVNPNQLNPELGTEEEFDELVAALQAQDMGWVQDIVPNHMAYSSENHFLMDVLESGPDSEYFDFFEIDWEHSMEDIRNRVLTPMLGDFYGKCLENGEIQLTYDENGLCVNYYSLKIPLRTESYAQFLTHDLGRLARSLGRKHPDMIKLLGILYILKNIPSETSAPLRRDQAAFVKGLIWELYEGNEEVKAFIEQNIEIFNGEVGKPESFNLLDHLLSEQFFRLSFWKVGAEELNYRRFFTVNELICVRIEDHRVFDRTHKLIEKLINSGAFTGLRIDHIDGLYHPIQYLWRLREKMGDVYVVVEKILEAGEELPTNWPIQGTSGYEFLSQVNGLFCQTEHEQQFTNIYFNLTGNTETYGQLFREKKQLIADTNLAGDADNLAHLLKRILGQYRYGRDFTLNGLRQAILELLVLFPVYRTYVDAEGVSERDRHYIQEAIDTAKAKVPHLLNELNLLENFFLLQYDESLTDAEKEQWLLFVMKLQQFSGPLMAKGIEDTLFYVYYRFLSLNEVGSSPEQFGISVEQFHQFNQHQLQYWPHSMNATATHDTKRSEDLRARLNVLSEIPDEWEAQVRTWFELNRNYKRTINGRTIPDANDEYFLYQTLVGAYPFVETEFPSFITRIKDFVVKAVREAKVHTAWLRPDTEYEEGFVDFVDKILRPTEDNSFLEKLREFQQRIAHYGSFNSLAQTLVKITAPGVPDFYQGTELWDLSLVDPDNRRPVDFEQRLSFLQEIKRRSRTNMPSLIEDLFDTLGDGRIKLFLITQALTARCQFLEVFQFGHYWPLELTGTHHQHAIAFARHHEGVTAIALIPRFLTTLITPDQLPLGEIWADTALKMPDNPQGEWHNSLTGQTLSHREVVPVAELLQDFPVALLINQSGGNS